jgi:transmembrane sensor
MRDEKRIEAGHLHLGWNDARTERLLARVKTRIGRRARVRRAVLASAALTSALGIAVTAGSLPGLQGAAPGPAPAEVAAGLIRLDEGSEIRADPATSEVRVVEQQPARVVVEAVRGRARFSVVPNPARRFEVRSGPVTVRVVGTEFFVEPRGETTWVEVVRGKVEVSWDDDRQRAAVAADESGLFPRAAAPVARDAPPPPRDGGNADRPRAQSPAPRTTLAYRSHVGRHDYHGAYALLAHHPSLAGDTVRELLIAADVARLSDHPAEALPFLERIVREHRHDERAPQAAFTLGRTLSGLGRTKEAMRMFGRVRRDWPGNSLAEDALVREAEAAATLGDGDAARRLADEYERDYPNGRRLAEVRRRARLE